MCETEFPELFTPITKLWAKGYKRTDHRPAELELSVIYCKACRPNDDVFIEEMFSPEARREVNEAALNSGKAPFNWGSALVEWVQV